MVKQFAKMDYIGNIEDRVRFLSAGNSAGGVRGGWPAKDIRVSRFPGDGFICSNAVGPLYYAKAHMEVEGQD